MNYRVILTLALLFFSLTKIVGQDKLYLEQKKKPEKKKYLELDRKYYIKTTKTTYSYNKIVSFTDTTISITNMAKTDKDTTYSYTYKIGKTKDTTYTYTQPIYRQDTIVIAFTDIQALEKEWFKNRKWLEPFGWIAIAAAMGVVMLPVAAIDKGTEGVRDVAVGVAFLVGISAPPIFIGTRKTTYDLTNKWTMKTE